MPNYPRTLTAENGYEIVLSDPMNAVFSRHGEAIGHLIFERMMGPSGQFELVDYDGVYCLPRSVAKALRAAGFHVDTTFD